ncbi:hypothetical protein FACS1894179_06750 [Bacteroidia bacterium]|nr:hypothetical protein FACS1894169_13940 [Bacteroidia bacterium]GHV40351.1 hypothetical protein FACS1894179_06750 [Bacteroidia bacterium]
MKEGERRVITISDSGSITVPSETKMSIGEIADLFGIYYRMAKRHIRTIEKSGIARGDDSMGCVIEGRNIYPEYYGLDMVIALAFRIQSEKAKTFRKWVLEQMFRPGLIELYIPISKQHHQWN